MDQVTRLDLSNGKHEVLMAEAWAWAEEIAAEHGIDDSAEALTEALYMMRKPRLEVHLAVGVSFATVLTWTDWALAQLNEEPEGGECPGWWIQ